MNEEHAEVEGTAVPVEKGEAIVLPEQSPQVPTREVLMPLDAGQVIDGMRRYQSLLKDLLDEGDWQVYEERGERKRFPKKSAWRKLSRAFNLSVQIQHVSVERGEDGKPLRAECVARAIAPNGQTQDADGYCALTEFKGKRADDVKLENTLRATATTRAKNRAIADLVGMGEVSAEEVTEATPSAPYGPPQTEVEQNEAREALLTLMDEISARELWNELRERFGGYLPQAFAWTAIEVAGYVREASGAEAKGPKDGG